MPIHLTPNHVQAFEKILPAMAEFKKVFGRDAKPEFVAEIYVARELGLAIPDRQNEQGSDAIGPDGRRYQVKFRNGNMVDLNNFDFDFLVLVNLDDDYRLSEMWRITADKAKEIFNWRGPKYHKYQASQASIKAAAERIR